ncbi:MAG: hypothetical protein HQM11_04260 [SAR324 cluster bacterium]|nr:hypothetical protein [SAR324 cluster bacterium]
MVTFSATLVIPLYTAFEPHTQSQGAGIEVDGFWQIGSAWRIDGNADLFSEIEDAELQAEGYVALTYPAFSTAWHGGLAVLSFGEAVSAGVIILGEF